MAPSRNNKASAASGRRSGRRSGRAGTDEEQPLLGQQSSRKSPWWRRKLMVNVSRDWADVVLLLCYIITGLLDSAAITTWGSFVSMQTGLCLASAPPSLHPALSRACEWRHRHETNQAWLGR